MPGLEQISVIMALLSCLSFNILFKNYSKANWQNKNNVSLDSQIDPAYDGHKEKHPVKVGGVMLTTKCQSIYKTMAASTKCRTHQSVEWVLDSLDYSSVFGWNLCHWCHYLLPSYFSFPENLPLPTLPGIFPHKVDFFFTSSADKPYTFRLSLSYCVDELRERSPFWCKDCSMCALVSPSRLETALKFLSWCRILQQFHTNSVSLVWFP